jgi:predicted unusual protein kinase regulating ubiquinone biosynthesis (AarF/ABC1/UbiB family)
MKEQNSIPVGKVARAGRFAGAGVKVGANYVTYFAKKMVNPETERSGLDKANARDIYAALSNLKGSALKMAQMLASDQHLLPAEYVNAFRPSQHKAPPLSGPLIVQVFKKSMGVSPQQLFDTFNANAVNAASIGQVHKATKAGKNLAVKIQYPGIADAISSDLQLVKPFAVRLLNVKESDVRPYFEEVEAKLKEEADYVQELNGAEKIIQGCANVPNLVFPKYYPEWSSDRILTMDWLEGAPLVEWAQEEQPQELRNKIGQAMWDFYDHQMHHLRLLHADPHPGNFLVSPDGRLGVVDFGCTKSVPQDFYGAYFAMLNPDNMHDDAAMEKTLYGLNILNDASKPEERRFFIESFRALSGLLRRPFDAAEFDFGDQQYFKDITALGEALSKDPNSTKFGGARGSKHILFVNRAYFGLFNTLNLIKAKVKTGMPAIVDAIPVPN